MTEESPPHTDPGVLYNFQARDTLVSALKFGAFTGTTGLLTGGVSSILVSSKTPALFALTSSLQWFLLGSTFWSTRSALLYAWSPQFDASSIPSKPLDDAYLTPKDRVSASTLAGCITGGTVGGLVRGRRNILPAALVWTVFGYAGQRIYNKLDERHSEQVAVAAEEATNPAKKEERGFWDNIAEMKWSPMKKLSDEEYMGSLREKVLSLDAQIALVDEEMENVKQEERCERKENESMQSEDLNQ
ncbi:hypothetical protein ACLMJK_009739 [Lecanora helva]